MKKLDKKKLSLSTHTIRHVNEGELVSAAGASVIYRKSADSNCPPGPPKII